jgi:hypothetical protein
MTLSPQAREALRRCIATRGKHKGQLLARCPASNTLAAAAWQGAMLSCNPYKASIAALLFMTPEQRTIQTEIMAHFDSLPKAYRVMADRDREILTRLGAW